MVYFIGSLIWCVICGCITKYMNGNKGYEGGFWWGFFLNIIGIIVVACKSENHHYDQSSSASSSSFSSSSSSSPSTYTALSAYAKEVEEKEMLSKGGWKCSKCGRVNPNYFGECQCGYTKVEHEREKYKKEQEEAELQKLQKLKSYKELLDAGVISQEEFDAKKAEIM